MKEYPPKEVTDEKNIHDSRFRQYELDEQEERNRNKKTLFFSVIGSSAFLMLIALFSSIYELTSDNVSTQKVAIITLLITAPIILVLALMRYIYDGKKIDDPQPTLMLNIGKEFAGVLTTIFKK